VPQWWPLNTGLTVHLSLSCLSVYMWCQLFVNVHVVSVVCQCTCGVSCLSVYMWCQLFVSVVSIFSSRYNSIAIIYSFSWSIPLFIFSMHRIFPSSYDSIPDIPDFWRPTIWYLYCYNVWHTTVSYMFWWNSKSNYFPSKTHNISLWQFKTLWVFFSPFSHCPDPSRNPTTVRMIKC
jgi:hypothetical protein